MVLGFDTATRATTVALQRGVGEAALEARDDPLAGERPRHTACLLPLVEDVLAQASASWGELERIAVGVGPGTFTGLRIGISTARALAQVLGIPVVAVPTLEALALAVATAHEQLDDGIDAVVSVLDARRGEVFAAAWSLADDRLTTLFGVVALEPRELARRLTSTEGLIPARALAVGDGAVAFRRDLEATGVAVPADASAFHRVSAVSHCRLGYSMPTRPPDDIHPCYVRAPDAVPRALAPTT